MNADASGRRIPGERQDDAIIQAARQLIARAGRFGVVTNVKGKHLVDTAFFRSADIPTAEVPRLLSL